MTYAPFKGISYPQHNFESAYTTLLEIKHLIEIIAGIKEPGRRAAFIDELEALKAQLINMINNAEAGIEEAPLDGTQYGRQSGAWTPVVGGGGGGGDVFGPGSATPDNPTVFNGATGKVIKEISYGTFKTNLALTKGDVGLSNVDNTSDMNKPVSTAQAAADALKANIASPTFTGDPKAPTPATADNDTSIATTAFVKAQNYAPLASPVFTGNPTGPTPAPGDNDTSLATTAFVMAALAATSGVTISDTAPSSPIHGDLWWESDTGTMFIYYDDGTSAQWVQAAETGGPGDVTGPSSAINGNPVVFDGVTGKVIAETTYGAFKVSLALTKSDVGLGNVDNTSDLSKPISTATQAALDLKAPLASPVFTGVPTAPTPAPGDNDTSIATTAFVTAAIAGAPDLTISDTPPVSPLHGDLWWESDSGILFIYYNDGNSSQWVAASPAGAGGDVTGPSSSVNGNPVIFDGITGKVIAETTYAAFKSSLAITPADLGLGTAALENIGTSGATVPKFNGATGLWTGLHTFSRGDNNYNITLLGTDDAAPTALGPYMRIFRDSATPAANDGLGVITFHGRDSAGVETIYSAISTLLEDPLDGAESGALLFAARRAGVYANRFRIGSGLYYNGGVDPGANAGNFGALQIAGVDLFARGNVWSAQNQFTQGNLLINPASGQAALQLRALAPNAGYVLYYGGAAGVNLRWAAGKFSSAESGSNAGADYILWAYADDGSSLGRAFHVSRATRAMTVDVSLTSPIINASSTLQVGGANINTIYAPLASPALTGNPTAPTPTPGDNDTSIATTAFVVAAIAASPDVTISDTAPGSPVVGDLWWNSNVGVLFIYYNDGTSSQWVQTSASGGSGDVVGPSSVTHGNPAVFDGTTGKVIAETTYAAFKVSLGLANVDNTSDANKPVSTAQQTALNLKADLASPTFTGDPKAPTPATADNDTSIATTAHVQANMALKANVSHTHAATDITSGTLADARLPTRIGVTCKQISDWNTIVENGWYSSFGAAANPPDGTENWFVGYAIVFSNLWQTQYAWRFANNTDADTVTYRREMNNGTWSAWTRVWHTEAELNARYATLASPIFTGNPTAPTPSPGDNDTSVATTAFVTAAVAASAAGGSVALVADTAPGSPTNGQLWFESDTGRLFVYYQDGTSNQWVQVIGGG